MTSRQKPIEYAVRLLAGRRHHSAEIKRKMLCRDYRIEEIEETINRLIEYKYLNDKEFIDLFIRDQVERKPQGMMLIRQKLLVKGIPKEEIDEATRQNNIDEYLHAEQALLKKLKTIKVSEKNGQKEKIIRFLASRGFTQSVIFGAVKKHFN